MSTTPLGKYREVSDIIIHTAVGELRFEETCMACPEQYDVWLGELRVGYVRLRGSRMRVDCPDVGGTEVFVHEFEGDDYFKGSFDDDTERYEYLTKAAAEIADWVILNNYGDEE